MSSNPTCYGEVQGRIIRSPGYQVCGGSASGTGARTCCGPGDICLGDGFCTTRTPVANGSSYYLGSCTDQSFPAPCRKDCITGPVPDAVYDATKAQWTCCGADGPDPAANAWHNFADCKTPVPDLTFSALPPDRLVVGDAFVTATCAVPSGSTVAVAASGSCTAPPPAGSVGLGAGPVAGIAVACAIAGVLAGLAGAYMLQRRQRRPMHEPGILRGEQTRGSSALNAK